MGGIAGIKERQDMTEEVIYSDIEIAGDDLALNGVQARILTNRDVIVQDLIHAIRESGHLVRLLAERTPASATAPAWTPFRARSSPAGPADRMRLTARTSDFGVISFYVNWGE